MYRVSNFYEYRIIDLGNHFSMNIQKPFSNIFLYRIMQRSNKVYLKVRNYMILLY